LVHVLGTGRGWGFSSPCTQVLGAPPPCSRLGHKDLPLQGQQMHFWFLVTKKEPKTCVVRTYGVMGVGQRGGQREMTQDSFHVKSGWID